MEATAGGARCVIRVPAALGAAHQPSHIVEAANAASGAEGGAVEGRHGIGKIEGFLDGHSLQDSIAERPVKDVAGTGGIDAVDDKSGRIVEPAVLAGERTV